MWQRFDINDYPGVHTWYRRVQGRPGWIWKATIAAAVVVFAIPVILLVLAALLAAAMVFTILSLVFAGLRLLRRLMPGAGGGPVQRDDGRRNVRVRITERHGSW